MHNLGLLYALGEGIPADGKKAEHWLKKAVENGDATSALSLARHYHKGKLLRKDLDLAQHYYLIAAQDGDTDAQFQLGYILFHKKDVPDYRILSHMWFNVAQSLGHETARDNKAVIEKSLTRRQIADARDRAKRCVKSNYTICK